MRRRIARARSSGNLAWSVAALLISLIAIAPIIAIFVLALQSSGDTWPHLIANVLPGALRRTIALMAGVGALTLLIGTGTAWLVTMYRFPGRSLFQWLLLLPLAMPTYIIAYCFLELFDYSGALQTGLRQIFGWHSAKDYWFPDIRSVGGAIFVMSMVLYPYVYITARASFLAQSVCVLEVSRTLGRSAAATFWEVALPLARPALAAGVALTLMETLNDIGAVEFFGVRTLTVAVYDTWLDRNSLAGAAQIACIMLAFVFAVLAIERTLRASRRYHHTTGRYRHLPEATLAGASGVFAALACALPVLIGFVLPASVLVNDALAHIASGLAPEFWQAALHSLMLSASAAVPCRRVRRDPRLCAPADAIEARADLEHRSRHQLRRARHRARHRPSHPARHARQCRRCGDALAVRLARPGCCSRAAPSPWCSPTPFASLPHRSARSRPASARSRATPMPRRAPSAPR